MTITKPKQELFTFYNMFPWLTSWLRGCRYYCQHPSLVMYFVVSCKKLSWLSRRINSSVAILRLYWPYFFWQLSLISVGFQKEYSGTPPCEHPYDVADTSECICIIKAPEMWNPPPPLPTAYSVSRQVSHWTELFNNLDACLMRSKSFVPHTMVDSKTGHYIKIVAYHANFSQPCTPTKSPKCMLTCSITQYHAHQKFTRSHEYLHTQRWSQQCPL